MFGLLAFVLIAGAGLGIGSATHLVEVEDFEAEVMSTASTTFKVFKNLGAHTPIEPEHEERPVGGILEVEPAYASYKAESGLPPPTTEEVEYLEITWRTRDLRMLVPSSAVQIEGEYVILPGDVTMPLDEVEIRERVATITSSTG